MGKKTVSSQRFRLSVPDADESVLAWIGAQLNLSASVRMLIRDDIQQNGFTDVSCRTVEQGAKRGRPSNAELERRKNASDEIVDAETVLSENEVGSSVQDNLLNVFGGSATRKGSSGASEDAFQSIIN